MNKLVLFDENVYLYKPISWSIGEYFKYDFVSLFVFIVLSYAIETCIYNKLACLYLGVNLYEKSYFSTIELYPEYIYIICTTNILISGFFVFKGIKILTK